MVNCKIQCGMIGFVGLVFVKPIVFLFICCHVNEVQPFEIELASHFKLWLYIARLTNVHGQFALILGVVLLTKVYFCRRFGKFS